MLHQFFEQIAAKDLKYPLPKVGNCRRRKHLEIPAPENEVNFRKRQRVVRAIAGDQTQFVGLGPEKFTPRRNVVEKILDRDLRSLWECSFATGDDLSARNFNRRTDTGLRLRLQG